MIYPATKEDFYSRQWSELEIKTQLDVLADRDAYVAITEKGFVRINLIQRIAEFVKGLIGGTDRCSEERIQGAWLKFLYYSEAHDLIDEPQLYRLRGRINNSAFSTSPVNHFLSIMEGFYSFQKLNTTKSKYLGRLRGLVTDFHRQHKQALRPGFWTRLSTSPTLDPNKLFDFGDTPLQFLTQALEQKKPDPTLAFSFLQNAFALKNDDIDFQEKLGDHLQNLEDSYPAELQGHQRKIQEMWIELAQNCFGQQRPDLATTYLARALDSDPTNVKKRLHIGRLYVMNQEYDLALPFLDELQQAHAQEPRILTEIGHSYWKAGQHVKAVAAYQTALHCYQKPEWKHSPVQKEMARLNHKLGMANLDNLLPSQADCLAKARQYFSEAVSQDPVAADYQDAFCKTCEEQWQANPDTFAANSIQDLFNVLKVVDSAVLKKRGAKVVEILMGCSDRLFNAHRNQEAHACLDEALRLFPDQTSLKMDALDLTMRHNDHARLKSKLAQWKSANYANPYLKMKIGDAYWNSDKTAAIEAYEEALDLFAKRVAASNDDKEKIDCQKCMGDIQAKIGQNHLQTLPGMFKGVPYEAALDRLEAAAKLNSAHAAVYFNACLEAAQAEKKRTALLRDTNKIIKFYNKAFKALCQKGEYLIDLFQLYLDTKREDDAVALYNEIQKQAWSSELDLPASLWSRLGKLMADRDDQAASTCLKNAYLNAQDNKQFKKDFFQLTYDLNHDLFQELMGDTKLNNSQRIEQLKKIASRLKDCWDLGFDGVPSFEKLYRELLSELYGTLAHACLQGCLIPKSTSGRIDRDFIKSHLQKHKAKLNIVLTYLNEGLEIDPKNASLHFDKGLLLEYWMHDNDEASKAYEKAVELQPNNPYYQWYLGASHFVVDGNTLKKDEHHALADQVGYVDFLDDRELFNNEMLLETKSKRIDPHAYTKKKTGWFS